MEADNDAGAVSTYMQAGGRYGLHLVWILIVLLPICYLVQEMVAPLGIATGKGHAAMIWWREPRRRLTVRADWQRLPFRICDVI
jgi:Mn2+/Fe2+ NRAMP family transporter